PIAGDSHLALKTTEIIVTSHALKCGASSLVNRKLGVKIGAAVAQGESELSRHTSVVIKTVPHPWGSDRWATSWRIRIDSGTHGSSGNGLTTVHRNGSGTEIVR